MDLINSINIELDLDRPENEARSTSQSLCDGQVLPALERVMRRFEDEDIVIEQPLVIELGEVPEGQLALAVEDAFYRALAKRQSESTGPLEVTLSQVQKPVPEVFLDYLQFPVVPWDAEDVAQFDEHDMMLEAARKALSSEEYLARLASLVLSDVENCKRFFDLPWPKEEFLPVMQRLLSKIPTLQGEVFGRLLQLLGDDKNVKPSLIREVFYYILSGVLFGNRGDAVNREAVAALLVIGKEGSSISAITSALPSVQKVLGGRHSASPSEKAVRHTRRNEPGEVFNDGFQKKSAAEIDSFIAERREALKRRLAHDERMRSRLIRLIQLVGFMLKGEVTFSQHVAELERILEMLRLDDRAEFGKIESHTEVSPKGLPGEVVKEVATDKAFTTATMGLKRSSSTEETIEEKVSVTNNHETAILSELSEEDVIEIIASLSVLYDEELKTEASGNEKARLQEVVSAIIRKQPDLDKRIPVHNAGLVLFQPYLISFFDRLGLLESREGFKSLESQLRAAHLLHELSGFKGEQLEHLLPLNKLLCGINIMFPIGSTFEATEEERHEVEALLKAVIRNWSAIGNASPAGIQEAFVRREGLLERSQDEWILRVVSKGIDILLDYIPWDIHTVSLPWNDYLIFVDWKV